MLKEIEDQIEREAVRIKRGSLVTRSISFYVKREQGRIGTSGRAEGRYRLISSLIRYIAGTMPSFLRGEFTRV